MTEQKYLKDLKIGFLGFGKMGYALAEGMVKECTSDDSNNIIKKENIFYYTRTVKKHRYTRLESNAQVATMCDVIILAVKPNVASSVLYEIQENIGNKILVSICAGLTIEQIENMVSPLSKIVRVMPNTPCLVNESASCLCANAYVTAEDKKTIISIFSKCGIIEEIEEHEMNAVTALAGSGPAYVFLFIESLIDAGVKNGLSRELAKKLVLKTLKGSVKLAENSDLPIQQLKDDVCSPGGTTIHGLFALEKNTFKFSIMDAVDVAVKRASNLRNTTIHMANYKSERLGRFLGICYY